MTKSPKDKFNFVEINNLLENLYKNIFTFMNPGSGLFKIE